MLRPVVPDLVVLRAVSSPLVGELLHGIDRTRGGSMQPEPLLKGSSEIQSMHNCWVFAHEIAMPTFDPHLRWDTLGFHCVKIYPANRSGVSWEKLDFVLRPQRKVIYVTASANLPIMADELPSV